MATTNGWGLIGTGRIADDRILPGINACEGNKLIGVVQPRPGTRGHLCREVRCAARLYELRGDAAQPGGDGGGDTHAELAARRPGRRGRARRQARVLRQADGDERRPTPSASCASARRRASSSGSIFTTASCPASSTRGASSRAARSARCRSCRSRRAPARGPAAGSERGAPRSATAGLGTTYSIGVHVYDILRYLLASEVTMVSAFFDTPQNVMEETNLSLFRFANGVLGQLSVHEKTPCPHNDFVVYGSKGRILGRGLTRSRAGGELHRDDGGRKNANHGISVDQRARGVRRGVQQGARSRAATRCPPASTGCAACS